MTDPSGLLIDIFRTALRAVDPDTCIPRHLPDRPSGRVLVLGAGKAAAAMAQAVERSWPGPLEGLVVTRYGHGVASEAIKVAEAGHPVPDAAGVAAATRILDLARQAEAGDTILFLLSGGASALLTLPAPGLTLEDKAATTEALLRAGAPIGALNMVRRHLSAIKGGRLAAATAARIVTLAISDVVGDDPVVIGSGPTVADPTRPAEARAALARFGIAPRRAVARHLARAEAEAPKPAEPPVARPDYRIVASGRDALDAAMTAARNAGVHPILHSANIEGEARRAGEAYARMALHRQRHGVTPLPALMLSGGETTVTVRGTGRGGPNLEFLLSLAIALDGAPGIRALAADTDGSDGTAPAAGAIVTPDTLARAAALGLDPRAALENNDSARFFEALGDLVLTGPTRTNVSDFRAILITAP